MKRFKGIKIKRSLYLFYTTLIFIFCFIGIGVAQDEFIEIPEKINVSVDKEWAIQFNNEVDETTITPENIYITDSNKNKIEIGISLSNEKDLVNVTPVNHYNYETDYYLYITKDVCSVNGTGLKQLTRMKFTTQSLIANPGQNKVTYQSFNVTLDGSKSTVSQGGNIMYSWRFINKPAGSTAELLNKTSINPSFVADQTGEYVAGLIVSDGIQSSIEKTVTIKVKSFGDTTDDISFADFDNVSQNFIEGYVLKKPIPLSDGWLITADNTNKIKIINVFNGDVGKEYQLSAKPNCIDFDFEKQVIIASLQSTNKIAKISVLDDEITYIDTPYCYEGLVLGEDHLVFSISNEGNNAFISIIDIEENKILNSISASIYGAGLMAYDKAGNNLYVADRWLSPSSLFRYSFDEETKQLNQEQYIWDMGSNGQDLAISNDGKHIAFCCGSGNGAGYTIFDIDSSDITKKFGEWNIGDYPEAAAFTIDDQYLIVSSPDKLRVFHVENHYLIATIEKNRTDFNKVCFSRGSKIIYNIIENNIVFYKNDYTLK